MCVCMYVCMSSSYANNKDSLDSLLPSIPIGKSSRQHSVSAWT